MPLNTDKILIAFNHKTFGEWEQAIHNQMVISFISPVAIFISITVPPKDYDKFNLMNLSKLIIATLVLEKAISNTQQIIEIGCEKKKGPKQELLIFLTHE